MKNLRRTILLRESLREEWLHIAWKPFLCLYKRFCSRSSFIGRDGTLSERILCKSVVLINSFFVFKRSLQFPTPHSVRFT